MNESWVETVDNDWIKINLIDIENCFTNPNYVWDAFGFSGILSFAQFFIEVRDRPGILNPELDRSFLNDDRLPEKLVYALKQMLADSNSQEQLENIWEYLTNEIQYCLSRLENSN
ncbi:MAG: hypothetical protein AAGA60_04140 [Cyanobacteria bacterium P01_E01_bin.42]